MKQLKNSLTIRGDSLYCPLPLSLDSYGNCLVDCVHCYFRNLNAVWGQDLKPVDLELLDKQLTNGPLNKTPKTPLAYCLSQKKTIRFGNKADPFQPAELEHRVSREAIKLLIKHNWTFVIQTRFTHILMEYLDLIQEAHSKNLITIMPVISPGLDRDWEVLEHFQTTPVFTRLKQAKELIQLDIPLGINGEPFIPGYHTVEDFEITLQKLKLFNIPSYNTYNFHFNAFVAKRLHAIGIDIEKIWYYNQDAQWQKILQQLLDLSKQYGIRLGCPDFVNSGTLWRERANTCCGVEVANPCTYNTHHFKRAAQRGKNLQQILNETWDGSGDYEQGKAIILGTTDKMFTLKDAGFNVKDS
jgi:DNA repair photolyase